MIPALNQFSPVQQHYMAFIRHLKADGFNGEVSPDYANRIVQSTDNSIYQVLPQAVIYPTNIDDLMLVARLSNEPPFQDIVLSPRGGGTGTNGQSLTDGLVVDLSRHMNQILEINAEERWVRVQPGVVKDQLNAALKPHGLFFAPELSTSNRATIGGMINTDASGQGSVSYGKTRDHVLELNTVLLDGSLLTSSPVDDEELATLKSGNTRAADIYQLVDELQQSHEQAIAERFPPLNRCLTGYDLAHLRQADSRFNLNSILCGSEGTLGFIAEAKLNVLPIPKTSALVNIQYGDFQSSLRDAQDLMTCAPTSIETVDSKVLKLAQGDNIWVSVADYFPQQGDEPIAGLNLVEYTADSEDELKQKVAVLEKHLASTLGKPGKPIHYTIAWGTSEVKQIWAMRKKSVGLLGNADGEARPIPFVEDTAVPPENLADFIMEFRGILDEYDLPYGMFGHVDCGVLHVRPALDMKDPEQAKMIRVITDRLVKLVQKYNGLLWGEHGKGVRSEYSPEFFGPLYPVLQQIKGVFDPRNQLNPGKIATPIQLSDQENVALLKIDQVGMRGDLDRTIASSSWKQFSDGMYCNGNGACFNYDPADAMCPSYKATRDRKHSPKGRASLVREWLRLLSEQGIDSEQESSRIRTQFAPLQFFSKVKNSLRKANGEYDFSHEVGDAMAGCLACKSCTGTCPIKVDVPEIRAKFFELYYGRYLRPLKDYFIGTLEFVIPWLAKWPLPYNLAMSFAPVQWLLKKGAGMVDSPLIATASLARGLKQHGIHRATPANLHRLTDEQKSKAVILVQDAFTSYFEPQTVIDSLMALKALGFHPLVMPYAPNGKPLHVHGFLKSFTRTAEKTRRKLQALANSGIPLMGMDPSMTLAYRAEYKKYLAVEPPEVLLPQEFLAQHLDHLRSLSLSLKSDPLLLMSHCTENTNAAASIKMWQQVFDAVGIELNELKVGCCGMAGTYGHETKNRDTSEKIYQLSWSEPVNNPDNKNRLLSTGYSCRSQVKRLDRTTLQHPLQRLLQLINKTQHQP